MDRLKAPWRDTTDPLGWMDPSEFPEDEWLGFRFSTFHFGEDGATEVRYENLKDWISDEPCEIIRLYKD